MRHTRPTHKQKAKREAHLTHHQPTTKRKETSNETESKLKGADAPALGGDSRFTLPMPYHDLHSSKIAARNRAAI